METLRAIVTRRSTLKFKSVGDVSKDTRIDLLRAAMSAPSAEKKGPWHFVVIKDAKTLKDLTILLRGRDSLQSAAMVVVVCADNTEQRHMGQWVIDCAAATQNLVLAAHDKGLGSAWVRIFPSKSRMKTVGELLGVPHHVTPFSAVFLGKPEKALGKRAAPIDETKVHLGSW